MSSRRYQIEFAPAAKRQIKKLPKKIQNLIIVRAEKLQINPRPSGVKKLVGQHSLYRIALGAYRIIYKVDDNVLLVLIVKVGNRKDIYRGLSNLH
jgi:mRNA interferase RelE/StbE